MSKQQKSARAGKPSTRRTQKPAARTKRVNNRGPDTRTSEPAAFHDDPAIDDLFAMIAALTAEISVAFDRIATLERLLEQRGVFAAGAIEDYEADEAERVRRRQARDALIQRVFRMLTGEREGLAKGTRR